MSAPQPGQCGAPGRDAARCTRPEDHKGGHRDEARDIYWQADDPQDGES